MGKIIDADNLDAHHVKKFSFASLEVDEAGKSSFDTSLFSEEGIQETSSHPQEDVIPKKEEPKSDITELLEKIEHLTNENITLSSTLESLEKEFDQKLKEQSEAAYQKGKEEGMKDSQETLQEHHDDLSMQLVKSITTIDEQLQQHKTFLENVKSELVEASIIIAQKIIKKELEEKSQEIARILADTFLEDLKEASEITLKVNPKDANFIKEHYHDRKNIKIEADDAINKGGIIILTDIGNIDGNIDRSYSRPPVSNHGQSGPSGCPL